MYLMAISRIFFELKHRRFVPLPKSATPSRIHSNANVYDFDLSAEDMSRLNALDQGKTGSISWNPIDVA
jgi:diketogulonate reductase-like aldo/keto reductase